MSKADQEEAAWIQCPELSLPSWSWMKQLDKCWPPTGTGEARSWQALEEHSCFLWDVSTWTEAPQCHQSHQPWFHLGWSEWEVKGISPRSLRGLKSCLWLEMRTWKERIDDSPYTFHVYFPLLWVTSSAFTTSSCIASLKLSYFYNA